MIAATTTVLALGALTAFAVSSTGTTTPRGAATTGFPAAAAPTEVRTVVVTKIIHRTRRAKAPRSSAPAPTQDAPSAAPARVAAAPVQVAQAVAAPPAAPAATAAPRSHERDGEGEGGSDD